MTKAFRIAHIDLVLNEQHFLFPGLTPFEIDPGEANNPIEVHYDAATPQADASATLLDTFDFPDAGAICRLYKLTDGHLFTMSREEVEPCTFYIPTSGPVRCNFASGDDRSLMRFGLWILFNLRASARGALAIHSSVLIHREAAVLCLGESGTGKSTHTRLWREHITGTELLNDDSPILALVDGQVRIFGSPWSGKTPCYRNLDYPIQGFLRLSQAPENRITKLSTLRGYGSLQPSMPPSFSYDAALFERVNALLSATLSQCPVYHLACLPNSEAAELACQTLYGTAE